MPRFRLIAVLLTALLMPLAAVAQSLDTVVADSIDQIEKPSRRTVGPLVDQIAATGPQGLALLQAWANRNLVLTEGGDLLILDGDTATDALTGEAAPAPDATNCRKSSRRKRKRCPSQEAAPDAA